MVSLEEFSKQWSKTITELMLPSLIQEIRFWDYLSQLPLSLGVWCEIHYREMLEREVERMQVWRAERLESTYVEGYWRWLRLPKWY